MGPDNAHPGPTAAADLPGVGYLLGVAHRARRRVWEADLADLGLTAPQAAVLRLLAARPGTGVRGLSRALVTDPMNVQRIASTLLAAGLCEVRRDPDDGRRRPLHLTDTGRRVADLVTTRADATERRLVTALGAKEYALLSIGLRRLVDLERAAKPPRRGPGPSASSPGGPPDPRDSD